MSAPTELVTDQGKEFSSQALATLCDQNNIQHHITPPTTHVEWSG